MNPYIGSDNGLEKNKRSPHFGRYRLCFNQVYPFREPLHNRLVIKIKNTVEAKTVFDNLPKHIQIIHFFKQKNIRENKYWDLDFFEDDDTFLVFEMLSDVIYIALENIYYSVVELAPFMEDCQFFVFSNGDGNTHWIDEYCVKSNKVTLKRSYFENETYTGRLDFYLKMAAKNPKDNNFLKFVLFQLYDRLHSWTKGLEKYPTKNSVNNSSLKNTYIHYLNKLYSIDPDCQDLYALNKKYNFDSIVL